MARTRQRERAAIGFLVLVTLAVPVHYVLRRHKNNTAPPPVSSICMRTRFTIYKKPRVPRGYTTLCCPLLICVASSRMQPETTAPRGRLQKIRSLKTEASRLVLKFKRCLGGTFASAPPTPARKRKRSFPAGVYPNANARAGRRSHMKTPVFSIWFTDPYINRKWGVSRMPLWMLDHRSCMHGWCLYYSTVAL